MVASNPWVKSAVNFCVKVILNFYHHSLSLLYEGWNFNSGNYLFTTDTK